MRDYDWMKGLRDVLSPFDGCDTLAAVAALQIIPENASRGVRLEAASHALASISHTPGRPRITGHRLNMIFNNPRSRESWLCRQEDSIDGPFVEAVTFYGGSYNTLPGLRESATFITRHLVSALFQSSEDRLPGNFRRVVRDLYFLSFTLTHRMCDLAGLRRNVPAKHASDVLIPNAKTLEVLKSAVTFSQSELERLETLHRSGAPLFRQLICQFGVIRWSDYRPDSTPLSLCPIIQEGSSYVIAVPSYLIPAVEIEIRALAHRMGLLSTVANLYRDAVWRTIREVVGYLGCTTVDIQLPALPNEFTCVAEGVFQIDADKMLYILLQTDPLEDVVMSEPQSLWTLPAHDRVVRRLHEVRACISQNSSPETKVLVLNLLQSMGRETITGYSASDIPEATFLLGMGAVDFETIALLEMHNPLALWKYAVQHARIRESTRVTSFSALDEYSMYRRSGQSYYASDGKRPNAMFFTPGGGGLLRQEVAGRFDFHGVLSPVGEGIIEVTALHQTVRCPLYIRYPIDSSRMLLLVEIAGRSVWIVGPGYNNEREQLLHKYYYQIGEAIGYWLWQFSSALTPIILKTIDPHTVFTIGLTLLPVDASQWDNSTSGLFDAMPAFSASMGEGGRGMVLTCRPSCFYLFHKSDNSGERQMMGVILSAFAEVLHCECDLGPNAILAILDQYAPLGRKKKILVLQESRQVELARLGNEELRPVQDSDQNEVLDDIGRFLVEQKGMVCAPIPPERRVPLLNEIVTFLFQTIMEEVKAYGHLDLLLALVRWNEAAILAQASHRFTVPAQLACYGDEIELLDKIRKDTITFNDTATAVRLLVEYVVAQPTKGNRPLPIAALDRLLACSSQLQRLGNASDAVKYGVENMSLSILPSGRLGISRESDDVINTFNRTEAEFSLAHSSRQFGRGWDESVRDDEDGEATLALRGRVDECTKTEWGVSLGEIIDVIDACINLGFEREQSVVLLNDVLPEKWTGGT